MNICQIKVTIRFTHGINIEFQMQIEKVQIENSNQNSRILHIGLMLIGY